MKAAERNPELSSKCRTRAIGGPRKRWEDDINEFLKLVEDETENSTESSSQIQQNMDQSSKRPWKMDFTRRKLHISEERQENNARMRMSRNNQSRPARYVNGVRLSDEEAEEHQSKK